MSNIDKLAGSDTDKPPYDPWANLEAETSQAAANNSEAIYPELNFLDNFRLPEERQPTLPRGASLEDYERATRERNYLTNTLQGELSGEDIDFKDCIRTIVFKYLDGDEPIVAYNPGSGTHVSMAAGLPEGSRAIFLDNDGHVAHKFIQRNMGKDDSDKYEFCWAEMEGFELPNNLTADLVLVYNAGTLSRESLDLVVKVGGIVAVNDWHGAASTMGESYPNYLEEGVVKYGEGNETLDLHVFRRWS